MLEKIRYVNHLGEEIAFGMGGIYVNCNELHDYTWTHTAYNQKISSFSTGIVTKTLPVVIFCSSEQEGLELKNKLMEYSVKDVIAMQHGKIFIGEFYLKCFITASKKKNYLYQKGYMEVTLTITTDYPQWIREKIVSFRKRMEKQKKEIVVNNEETGAIRSEKRNFDYNYDFGYDYKNDYVVKPFENIGVIETNFRLLVYGPCINPEINIAGHTYQVNVQVPDGAVLTVDSLVKQIYMTDAAGKETNCFNLRNRNSYIFKRIPAGKLNVATDGTVEFDVVIIEERCEPEWI